MVSNGIHPVETTRNSRAERGRSTKRLIECGLIQRANGKVYWSRTKINTRHGNGKRWITILFLFFFFFFFSTMRRRQRNAIYRFVFNGLSRRSGHGISSSSNRGACKSTGPDRRKNTVTRRLNASNDNTAFIEETRAFPVATNAAPFEYQIKRGKYAARNGYQPIQRFPRWPWKWDAKDYAPLDSKAFVLLPGYFGTGAVPGFWRRLFSFFPSRMT